jgi:hypothetical protein
MIHIAKHSVKTVLGKENEYVERLLINKLFGHNKEYRFTPLSELIPPIQRTNLEKIIQMDVENAQKKVVEVLDNTYTFDDKTTLNYPEIIVDSDRTIDVNKEYNSNVHQSVSSWIVNTILQEKLYYRKIQESAERRKNIYGILTIVLPCLTPIITGIIQYYITLSLSSSSL